MKDSIIKSYEEMPLFLSAQMVADVLGVSISSAYELMHEDGFPSLRIGNRLVIPKDHFRRWVEEQVGK
jgi:excisionase family DNA binding protein